MKHAALPALLLLVVAGGCKKKAADLGPEFRDAICRCKDVACIEQVGKDFTARAGKFPQSNIDKDVLEAATKCVEKVYAVQGSAPAAGLPALPPTLDADALIGAARASQTDPRMPISSITVEYVDAKGMLDETYGGLWVTWGLSTKPFDDPKRKTGAPVPTDTTLPETCPTVAFARKGPWTVGQNECTQEEPYVPRCTVAQIWRRAIAQAAPPDALAVIKYRNLVPPSWTFTIRDAPRNVNIALELPDDCERQLEQSP